MEHNLFAVIRYFAEGFHAWPEAPESRQYLAARHRHQFHVEVKLEVYHHDREVEYHDLLDFCRNAFFGGELGRKSCELMCQELSLLLHQKYGNRECQISIFEDGEVGAILQIKKLDTVSVSSERDEQD